MEGFSKLACIDLEGVLVPELWPEIAARSGIVELFATTREIPDYHAHMRRRIFLLRQHEITLDDVRRIIRLIKSFAGATAFLRVLESRGYCVTIVSACCKVVDAAPIPAPRVTNAVSAMAETD